MSFGAPSSSIWRSGTERILLTRSRRRRAVVAWEKCASVSCASALVRIRPSPSAAKAMTSPVPGAPRRFSAELMSAIRPALQAPLSRAAADVQMTMAGE